MNREKLYSLMDRFHIAGKLRIWIIAPLAIILVAVAVFAGYAIKDKSFSSGINIGLDFAGGSAVTVPLGKEADDNYDANMKKVSEIIAANGCTVSYRQMQSSGDTAAIYVRYKNIAAHDDENGGQTAINDKIKTDIEAAYPDYFSAEANEGLSEAEARYVQVKYISATASSSLLKDAFLAIIITLVVMLIYIFIRFEVLSGVAAVIALLHDVVMIVALTVIFHIQVNSSFIAAVITIVAYSINNTIVVFDRLRENKKLRTIGNKQIVKIDFNELTDQSIYETFTRSLYTTVTTFVVVLLLGILGGATLREFTWPLVFGLAAGFYSSLVIAPSLYAAFQNKRVSRNVASRGPAQPAKKTVKISK